MYEIKDNSEDDIDLIVNCFKFGYLQGVKAERARRKINKLKNT